MNTKIIAYKRIVIGLLASFSVFLIVITLAFYSSLQTAKGSLHPIFGFMKLITSEGDVRQVIQALDSADPEALKVYRDLVAQLTTLTTHGGMMHINFCYVESQYTFQEIERFSAEFYQLIYRAVHK